MFVAKPSTQHTSLQDGRQDVHVRGLDDALGVLGKVITRTASSSPAVAARAPVVSETVPISTPSTGKRQGRPRLYTDMDLSLETASDSALRREGGEPPLDAADEKRLRKRLHKQRYLSKPGKRERDAKVAQQWRERHKPARKAQLKAQLEARLETQERQQRQEQQERLAKLRALPEEQKAPLLAEMRGAQRHALDELYGGTPPPWKRWSQASLQQQQPAIRGKVATQDNHQAQASSTLTDDAESHAGFDELERMLNE